MAVSPDPEDLDIRWVTVGEVTEDPANPNKHNERNLATIEASLRRFGQRKPLVVDEGLTVVAGNGTLQVMRDRLGWDRICVSVFPGTAAEARAYGIADNRTGELAAWDETLLVRHLEGMDQDLLAAAGYSREELDDLLMMAQPANPPELPPYEPPPGLPNDHQTRYADKAQWTLFYDYPNEVFVWLIENLAAYREEHGLDSNTEAVLAIAEEISGETRPAT